MSIDYWRDRYKLEEAVRARSDAEFEAQLKAVYQQHIRDVQNEIDGFWQRYADRNGITKLEAQKQADKIDVTLVGFKAKQLVERAERLRASGKIVDASYFTKAENDLMRLYNLKMKTSRLEVLQANLKLLQYELAMSEHESTQRHLIEAVRREHLYSSGILKETLGSYETPKIKTEAIIYANFHGARWDKTIWKRQDALRSVVKKAVADTVLRGHGTTPLIKQIEREFKVSYSYARRLAVTETARVYSEAQRLNYEANGFDEYEIIAESGACGVCAPLNGTHHKVSAMAPGYNAPPFHPNCRCTTGAYYSLDHEASNGVLGEDKRVESKELGQHQEALNFSAASDYQKFESDLTNLWEDISEGRLTESELTAKLDYAYNLGVLSNLKILDNFKPQVFISGRDLARTLAKHGTEFPLEQMLLIKDMISSPDVVADNSDHHKGSVLLYEKIPDRKKSVMEGAIIPKEDGSYLIHYHKIGKHKINKLRKNNKILYEDKDF